MDERDNDYWVTDALASPPVDQPEIVVETITGVVPLDEPFGVSVPKPVPDAIRDALFGPRQNSLGLGGDPDTTDAPQQPFWTYAVFDAAKVTNLVQLLEASGLEYRCMFQGDAYKELADVAPWIVRLEEGNSFTRHLFTTGTAPWFLWQAEPALYLRSDLSLDEIWRHLRKFTKVQDNQQKWFFFRFWELHYFHVFADRADRFPQLRRIWGAVFSDMWVLAPRVAVSGMVQLTVPRQTIKTKLVLDDTVRQELKLSVLYRNMIDAAFDLHELHPKEARVYGDKPETLWPHLYEFADEVQRVGLRDPELRARMMLLAFLKYPEPWPAFLELPFWQKIQRSPGQANDLFEDFCSRLKLQSVQPGNTLEVWW